MLSDADLEALIGDKLYSPGVETWELCDLVVSSSSKDGGAALTSTATVTLLHTESGQESMQAAIGIGPVDATFKAILKTIALPVTLTQYQVNKIEGGSTSSADCRPHSLIACLIR